MPTIKPNLSLVRLLEVGDPGTGKTGALASLVDNMDELGLKKIVICDMDEGIDPLGTFVTKGENLSRVHYQTFRDKFKPTAAGPMIVSATALQKCMTALNKWTEGTKDEEGYINLGAADSWGPETLLVLDSLTGMGDAAIAWSRETNNAKLTDSDWQYTADAMNRQDKLVQMLISLKCHVIVTSHIRFMGGGGTQVSTSGESKIKKELDSRVDGIGYPSALGQKLPPEIGRHFNTILQFEVDKLGNRKIRTKQASNIRVKSAINIKPELSIETGLYEYFKAAMGK